MAKGNLAAEAVLVGASLVYPEAFSDLPDRLEPEHFSDRRLRELFAAMRALHRSGAPITPAAIIDALPNLDNLDDYIENLMAPVGVSTDMAYHAGFILLAWERRQMAAIHAKAKQLLDDGGDPAETAAMVAEKTADLAVSTASDETTPTSDIISDALRAIEEGAVEQTSTGFAELDRLTSGGFGRGQLWTIGGATSVGKSSLALALVSAFCRNSSDAALLVSAEMGSHELMHRFFAMSSGVSLSTIRAGNVSTDKWPDVVNGADDTDRLFSNRLHLLTSGGFSIAAVRDHLHRLKKRGRVGLVCLDYLQLLSSGQRAESRRLEIGQISRACKMLAVEHDCTVLLLSQLSRDGTQGEPQLRHLKEAGEIENDSDIVLFLWRKERNRAPIAEINCAVSKNRSGPCGRFSLHWQPTITKFSSATFQPTGAM